MTTSTLTLIYLLGAGGTGSSALATLLGQHPDSLSIGEFSSLDRSRILDLKCSCGMSYSKCDFWSKIESDTDHPGYGFPIKPTATTFELIRYRSAIIKHDINYIGIIRRNLDLYNKISQISEKRIIIDSSKDLARFVYLFCSGLLRVVPVFVVRDGRAYIDTMARRSNMRPFTSVQRWSRKNLTTYYALKKLLKGQAIIVNYEDFVENTFEVLNRIGKWADLVFEKDMLDGKKATQHFLGGTALRNGVFHNELLTNKPIRNHNSWRERLKRRDRIIFSIMGGSKINKMLGIKNR